MPSRLGECEDMRTCLFVVSWLHSAFRDEGDRADVSAPEIGLARSLFDAIDANLEPELHIVMSPRETMEEWVLLARRNPP